MARMWLFLSGGDRIRLAADGLSTVGSVEKSMSLGYPEDWIVDGFSSEEPEWTADGWFRMKGGDLWMPLTKPKSGAAVSHGQANPTLSRNSRLARNGVFVPAPGRGKARINLRQHAYPRR